MDMSAEADLLRRAQAGDNEASDTLYREFFENNRQIHNLLLREVPAPEDREDILHDAFLSLVRSKSEFRGDSRLQTFVYRVVQIAILQKLRSDRARRHSKMVRLFVDLSGETRGTRTGGHRLRLRAGGIRPDGGQDVRASFPNRCARPFVCA